MRNKLIIAFLLVTSWVFAQVNELPIHFGQYFNNPQINPATGGSEGNVEVLNGNRRNQGNFGGIKTSYLSAFFRIKENKGSFHTLGLSFNNDREGNNLARNRIYASYSRHQKITQDWHLSAGVSSGLYSFSVKSNPVIGGASSGALDLNLGLSLYSEQTSLGFSINQLNGATVQPFVQEIRLAQQYNFIVKHIFEVNENLSITPSGFYRYANLGIKELNTRIGIGAEFLLVQKVNIGGSFETKEGAYAFLGLHNIALSSTTNSQKIDVDFSYFIPSKKNFRTNINAYELTLKYFISKNNRRRGYK